MERMPRLRIPATSAFRPELISSIRLLPRQWRLVGKLTMNFGLPGVPVWKDEHPARLHFPPGAGGFVGFKIRWKIILELKRDTATHDADAVDRIDQRFRIGPQDVSGRKFDHRHLPSVVPVWFDLKRRNLPSTPCGWQTQPKIVPEDPEICAPLRGSTGQEP